jgi:hypothetical protein
MYQLAQETGLLKAATASGGDLVEFFVDEGDDGGKKYFVHPFE